MYIEGGGVVRDDLLGQCKACRHGFMAFDFIFFLYFFILEAGRDNGATSGI